MTIETARTIIDGIIGTYARNGRNPERYTPRDCRGPGGLVRAVDLDCDGTFACEVIGWETTVSRKAAAFALPAGITRASLAQAIDTVLAAEICEYPISA